MAITTARRSVCDSQNHFFCVFNDLCGIAVGVDTAENGTVKDQRELHVSEQEAVTVAGGTGVLAWRAVHRSADGVNPCRRGLERSSCAVPFLLLPNPNFHIDEYFSGSFKQPGGQFSTSSLAQIFIFVSS